MQGKGLVKALLIGLVLVCLYQLSFTFFGRMVESKADSYANSTIQVDNTSPEYDFQLKKQKRYYLDSVTNKKVAGIWPFKTTYQRCKEEQLNLGLDLQGGMSVVMQISLEDLLRGMANNSTDPAFNQSLIDAKELMKSRQGDYVSLFAESFKKNNPNGKLSDIFSTRVLQDKINFNSSDTEVLSVIQEESQKAIERTFNIIRTRIDKFGVTQPNISLLPNTGRIIVELAGVDEPERVRKLLQANAKLEFWETQNNGNEVQTSLAAINNKLKTKLGIKDDVKTDVNKTNDAASDSLNTDGSSDLDLDGDTQGDDPATALKNSPLFSVMSIYPANSGASIGEVAVKDTAKLNTYLKDPEIRALFPSNVKFLYGAIPNERVDDNGDTDYSYSVYAVKSRFRDLKPTLSGNVVVDASTDYDAQQQLNVYMTMNAEGAKEWRKMTGENVGKQVAVVLDDMVYSAPVVRSEIAGGRTQIDGNFSFQEATDLSNILKAGSLPAPARIVEEAIVGPSLGQKSINAGLISLLAGILVVLGFMIAYYSNSGIVANIALLANLFFIIGVLASLKATLTLPGMAGIVLTIGMAVDANVIIFERIREELAKGSGVKKAIADGYWKSYSAIIDANITTLITAFILAYFGLGPVLGFATVLIIGIFSSMFTAILITRLIIEWRLSKGKDVKFWSGWSKGRFKNLNYNFISKRKLSYVASAIFIALGLIAMGLKGFDQGVDFKGGRTYVVQFDQDVSTAELTDALSGTLETAPLVRTFGGSNQVKITTADLIDSDDVNTDNLIENKVYTGLKNYLPQGTSFQEFKDGSLQSSQKVGPTIANDIKRGAIYATVFALLGIFFYILVRFRRWQFGIAAVITLAHDTLILLTIFSLFSGILPFSLEINQIFIAALLTVIGYSLNDTVVVFDRIREYLALYPNQPFKQVVNDAVNSTLSRTIITSLTTLIVVLIIFVFGGEVIRGFSFALLIGVIVGTYSSIFIATPIVVDLTKDDGKSLAATPKPVFDDEEAMFTES